MNVLSRGVLLVGFLAGVSACTAQGDQETSEPQMLTSIDETPEAAAATCGVQPRILTFWASEWQRDIMDVDGIVGDCTADNACVLTCWGDATRWTSWRGLVQCPCPAQ